MKSRCYTGIQRLNCYRLRQLCVVSQAEFKSVEEKGGRGKMTGKNEKHAGKGSSETTRNKSVWLKERTTLIYSLKGEVDW